MIDLLIIAILIFGAAILFAPLIILALYGLLYLLGWLTGLLFVLIDYMQGE